MRPRIGRTFLRTRKVPALPPAEALAAVERAGERAAELAAQDRELHFRIDPETGRVVVEVRDLAGRVIATIPPSRAVAVMAGVSL